VTFFRSETELNQWVTRLLSGPAQPRKAFVLGGTTFGRLYEMAAHLNRVFQDEADASLVCLCAEDKCVVTATLLASLAGGPAVILPYASSPQVLSELHDILPYALVVADRTVDVPPSVRCIIPEAGKLQWPAIGALSAKAPEAEWVRLFTGGSTGAPKMWTKTVRNLLAETISIVNHYHVTDQDRLVSTVNPNHIYGLLYSILTPLLASAAVSGATPSFPGEIEAAIAQAEATILVSVPAHYRGLNGHAVSAPDLRLAFSSAGMLAAEDAAAFSAQTGVGIAEIYGSTETGGIAARVRAAGETDFKPYDTIGVCIEGEQLSVRSDYLSPELERDAYGCFVMGDRVAATAGGRFMLIGRADGIVKVGGRRVDLEAVKECIRQYPGVRDALVVSLPVDTGRENQVVAVVEGRVDAGDLGRFLTERLEPYARPRTVKVLDNLPMTAAGKYDRRTIENLFLSKPRNGGQE